MRSFKPVKGHTHSQTEGPGMYLLITALTGQFYECRQVAFDDPEREDTGLGDRKGAITKYRDFDEWLLFYGVLLCLFIRRVEQLPNQIL